MKRHTLLLVLSLLFLVGCGTNPNPSSSFVENTQTTTDLEKKNELSMSQDGGNGSGYGCGEDDIEAFFVVLKKAKIADYKGNIEFVKNAEVHPYVKAVALAGLRIVFIRSKANWAPSIEDFDSVYLNIKSDLGRVVPSSDLRNFFMASGKFTIGMEHINALKASAGPLRLSLGNSTLVIFIK